MSEKVFKTLEQQVQGLQGRNMTIDHPAVAMAVLKQENYYTLVNGYNDLFLVRHVDQHDDVGDDQYRDGTTFEALVVLYEFDRTLREILLRPLLLMEHQIGSVAAYVFSDEHGCRDYLKLENFDTATSDRKEHVSQLLAELYQDIAKGAKNDGRVRHYVMDHGYVPMWVLINTITLGRLSILYSNMQDSDRNTIARHFGVRDDELSSFLGLLNMFRNKCAHDDRVYNYKSPCSLTGTWLHAMLEIPQDAKQHYQYGTNDILAVLICTRFLLGDEGTKVLVRSIKSALDSLTGKLGPITVEDVRKSMRLPDNWQLVASLHQKEALSSKTEATS